MLHPSEAPAAPAPVLAAALPPQRGALHRERLVQQSQRIHRCFDALQALVVVAPEAALPVLRPGHLRRAQGCEQNEELDGCML